jgi:hypothetical protein
MLNENVANSGKQVAQVCTACESKVLDSTTLSECENKCYTPMGKTGPLVAKVPVVLSDVEIQIDVEAEIKLSEPAFDIKTIDKQVCLTQCKLVPNTEKLFIEGFIQKNIQFSTVDCANKTSISGKVQHTTVNVPFNCVTKIKLYKEPLYGKEFKKRLSALDNDMLCEDKKEDSWVHFSKFYDPVFCELEYSKIFETDIHCKDHGKTFTELVEKMVVYIRLKVLQNQKVFIPEYSGGVDTVEESDCSICKKEDKKGVDIEIGYDKEKGVVGRTVENHNFIED